MAIHYHLRSTAPSHLHLCQFENDLETFKSRVVVQVLKDFDPASAEGGEEGDEGNIKISLRPNLNLPEVKERGYMFG